MKPNMKNFDKILRQSVLLKFFIVRVNEVSGPQTLTKFFINF